MVLHYFWHAGNKSQCIHLKFKQWGDNKPQYWWSLLCYILPPETFLKPLSATGVFLKLFFFLQNNLEMLCFSNISCQITITPTHLTFLSPDKYLCSTAVPTHSKKKCGFWWNIFAQLLYIKQWTLFHICSWFDVGPISDIAAALNRSTLWRTEQKSLNQLFTYFLFFWKNFS